MLRGAAGAMAVAMAMLASAQGAGAGPPVRWTVYADCAGAYLANARLADPDRPASMTAQVSDVADDYAAAATARHPANRRAGKAAARAVRARVERTAAAFAGRPREAVEKVIDSCPQLAG